jgi:hypothetical protein
VRHSLKEDASARPAAARPNHPVLCGPLLGRKPWAVHPIAVMRHYDGGSQPERPLVKGTLTGFSHPVGECQGKLAVHLYRLLEVRRSLS